MRRDACGLRVVCLPGIDVTVAEPADEMPLILLEVLTRVVEGHPAQHAEGRTELGRFDPSLLGELPPNRLVWRLTWRDAAARQIPVTRARCVRRARDGSAGR